MNAMRRLAKRLRASLSGRQDDDRLREELAEHLELLTEEYAQAGVPLDEARRRARLKLGAADATTEAWRDQQRLRWLEDLWSDLRYGLRTLRRSPGFSAAAMLTLALGIGANLAIFALVYAVLIRPLPFRDPGEVMLVHLLVPDRDAPGVFQKMVWSYPKYQVLRDRQQVFSRTALFTRREWSLTNAGGPERLQGEIVGASYFALLGVETPLGRTFDAAEDRPGAPPVAIVSHQLWQRRFGGDAGVTGKVITLDGVPFTIVGVAPPGFHGLFGLADVWRPLMTTDPSDLVEPFSHSYLMVARRRSGVTVEQADAAVRVLGAQAEAAFSSAPAREQGSATAVPLDEERIDPLLRRAAYVLLGAVGLVLLIACVNLATLTLTRGLARQREVAIRLAIGASRLARRPPAPHGEPAAVLRRHGRGRARRVRVDSCRLVGDARLEPRPARAAGRPHACRRVDARRGRDAGAGSHRPRHRHRSALRTHARVPRGARRPDDGGQVRDGRQFLDRLPRPDAAQRPRRRRSGARAA